MSFPKNFIQLNYFDLVTISLTIVTMFAVQILNALYGLTRSEKSSDITETERATATGTTQQITSGKLQKQFSEQSENHDNEEEDAISLENLFPGDQSEIWQSKRIHYIIDELIETEWNYVVQLRKGLTKYGPNTLQQCQHLPHQLKDHNKRQQLIGNIDEILLLHEHQIYPCLLRYQQNLQIMFDELSDYIEKNFFYCYISFMINKKDSLQLRQENREWFQIYQTEINDKLGIDSFLVQPIQRLTKYPLLLKQLITEFYSLKCKAVLSSLCKLETRMRRLLELVNQSEELSNIEDIVPSELTINRVGYFRRSGEFEAHHHRSRKKFHCKILLFDNVIMIIEYRKKRLLFRQQYYWPDIVLRFNTTKYLTLLLKSINGPISVNNNSNRSSTATRVGSVNVNVAAAAAGATMTPIPTSATTVMATTLSSSSSSSLSSSPLSAAVSLKTATGATLKGFSDTTNMKVEYDFWALEPITHWLRWARKIIAIERQKSKRSATITIRMDIALGVVLTLWFIWQYL